MSSIIDARLKWLLNEHDGTSQLYYIYDDEVGCEPATSEHIKLVFREMLDHYDIRKKIEAEYILTYIDDYGCVLCKDGNYATEEDIIETIEEVFSELQ